MSTQTHTGRAAVMRPAGGGVVRPAVLALVAMTAVVMVASLMWPATEATQVTVGGYTRGELAQIERLEAQAAAHEQSLLQRGYEADAARWAAQADFYEQIRQARAAAAATARLQGQADEYLTSQMTRADRAWARRLQGQAELYLDQ